MRREISPALKVITPLKFNHDVVVPKGRIPQLFELVAGLRAKHRLRIPCFGHVGDGNIHVNIMVEMALMKGVKQAFDPHGIMNPGKIFPGEGTQEP